jgi:predicted RNA-binding protein with PUA-like domain
VSGNPRCWLFKTEPSCFSYDDLELCPGQTEHWDGVRNYQARNFLRDEVQVGDGVLFYHSNIPEPAVVGIARVVRGGYPDFTARDPQGEHFDPKSTVDKPIWYMVDVCAVRRLPRPVTLAELKAHPLLAGMVLLSRSRLSVQPVTKEEWEIIIRTGDAGSYVNVGRIV